MIRILLAALLLAAPAAAHTPGLTADENEWLDRQRARDGTKCCDFRDVFIGRMVEWRIEGGRYQVKISGEWRDVPPGRLMQHDPSDPSPFPGEAMLFYSLSPYYPNGFHLWCFSPENLT
jgi:hypothetical protein